MQKTYTRKRTLFILKIVLVAIVLIELAILVFSLIKSEYLVLIFTSIFMLFLLAIFMPVYLIEKNSKLILSNDKIVFYYHLFSKDKGLKGLNIKGLIIDFKNVKEISISLLKGDGIIVADTKKVEFILIDGRTFYIHFFHYGKIAEQEIITTLDSIRNELFFYDCSYDTSK